RVGMVHALDRQPAGWAGRFDVVIHAHSHRWRDEVVDRIRFINSGTATRPQFGGTERTMARLTFGERMVVEKLMVPRFAEVPAIRFRDGRACRSLREAAGARRPAEG